MTHLHTGNYAAKHNNPEIPEALREKLKSAADDNRLSCSKAHRLARETGFAPAEIGRAADLMELRLTECQLALFGQSRTKEKLKAAEEISPELREALLANLTNQRLPCLQAWHLAERFKLKKTEVTAACEALKIKISPCQLGAF
ncbi:MAG: hypothetical protein JXR80_09625 [Deltaproteobacteria bacterium]|nr:hypothetical protein [Deltaproteobacteria bacterium]